MRIPLWVDLRLVPTALREATMAAATQAGAERLLVAADDEIHGTPRHGEAITYEAGRLLHGGTEVGHLVRLHDAKGQRDAAAAPGIVVVDAADWKIIPLENLIAARRDRPGTLYALARSPQEAALFADTLEVGVHGVVLAPSSPQDVTETDRLLRARFRLASVRAVNATSSAPSGLTATKSDGGFALEAATVTRIEDAGMGDRVCVDATSLFADGEGLLVGSTARGFVLVHAETLRSEYVAARPFRVNAGALHMYVLVPGGKTRYLSELGAGDKVLAVSRAGVGRALTVGRAKVERRPHVLVEWQAADGTPGTAMLQNAETIRLVRPDGAAVAVTTLRAGDQVLVHREAAARHFGMPVDSHLEER